MVPTLRDLSLSATNSYVTNVIQEILDDAWCSAQDQTKISGQLNEYLVTHLNPSIIDELLSHLTVSLTICDGAKLMYLRVYMHRNMRVFQPKFQLPSFDLFYESQLSGMGRLVVLSLRMVCTDEILEVVGRSCPLLEIVDILSKIEIIERYEMNALKLKYFVSNEGLRHLHQCSRLRRIVMRKFIGSHCGGRKVTYSGIRDLLKALPTLEYIRYNDMGFVFDKDSFPDRMLNLIHIHDDHADPDHIQKFADYCPRLKSLCLVVPPVVLDADVPEKCMDRLASSPLSPTLVSLKGFSDGPQLTRFLQLKGQSLVKISLSHAHNLTVQSFIAIGENCPSLRNLEFHARKLGVSLPLQPVPFPRLECLKIIGSEWGSQSIIINSVFYSPNLKQLVLINHDHLPLSDWFLEKLVTHHFLPHLTEVVIFGFTFSLKALLPFVLEYRTLETLEISGNEDTDYNEFLEEVKLKNQLKFKLVSDISHFLGTCFCPDLGTC